MLQWSSSGRKAVALFLILVLLQLNLSCYYYTNTIDSSPTAAKLDKLKNRPNYLIVHQSDQVYHLKNVKVDQDAQTLSGILQPLPPDHQMYRQTKPIPGSSNRYKKTSTVKGDASPDVINEVHFYVKNLSLNENEELIIPLSSIEKIDVYDPDTGATTASFVLGGIGIALGTILIIGIIVLLTKSSCPFLYINHGESYQFAGEIYSGAIYKSLERDDDLALPDLHLDSILEIKISNKLKERQFINQVQLLQVAHPKRSRVLPDQQGNVHLIQEEVKMTNAEVNNQNVTALLQSHDSASFTFDQSHRDDYFNEVILTFPKSSNASEGHLILNAKNSLWGDYVFGEFTKLFGDYYPTWIAKQNKLTSPAMPEWAIEQGLAMKVYIQNGSEWKYVDFIDLVGPLAFRDVVVPIDLTHHTTKEVKLKISAGFMMWDVDYVGMDYSADKDMNVLYINPSKASTNGGSNSLAQINAKDEMYLAQENTGDAIHITFPLKNAKNPDTKTSYILYSRGYYNHVRDYEGSPQITTLLGFKSAGRFSKFSKEKLDEMTNLMRATEISVSTNTFPRRPK
jgi:hypothetical protein